MYIQNMVEAFYAVINMRALGGEDVLKYSYSEEQISFIYKYIVYPVKLQEKKQNLKLNTLSAYSVDVLDCEYYRKIFGKLNHPNIQFIYAFMNFIELNYIFEQEGVEKYHKNVISEVEDVFCFSFMKKIEEYFKKLLALLERAEYWKDIKIEIEKINAVILHHLELQNKFFRGGRDGLFYRLNGYMEELVEARGWSRFVEIKECRVRMFCDTYSYREHCLYDIKEAVNHICYMLRIMQQIIIHYHREADNIYNEISELVNSICTIYNEAETDYINTENNIGIEAIIKETSCIRYYSEIFEQIQQY